MANGLPQIMHLTGIFIVSWGNFGFITLPLLKSLVMPFAK
jgi:hypothetical protein